jgi:hypothetical protein
MADNDTGIRKIIDQLLGDIDFEHERMQELRACDEKGADEKYKMHSDRYVKLIDTYKNAMVKYAEIRKGETLADNEEEGDSVASKGKSKSKNIKKLTVLEDSRR